MKFVRFLCAAFLCFNSVVLRAEPFITGVVPAPAEVVPAPAPVTPAVVAPETKDIQGADPAATGQPVLPLVASMSLEWLRNHPNGGPIPYLPPLRGDFGPHENNYGFVGDPAKYDDDSRSDSRADDSDGPWWKRRRDAKDDDGDDVRRDGRGRRWSYGDDDAQNGMRNFRGGNSGSNRDVAPCPCGCECCRQGYCNGARAYGMKRFDDDRDDRGPQKRFGGRRGERRWGNDSDAVSRKRDDQQPTAVIPFSSEPVMPTNVPPMPVTQPAVEAATATVAPK